MTRALIGIEIVCLLVVLLLAFYALSWTGPENWALVGLLLYGGPALIVLLAAMIVALILVTTSKAEAVQKTKLRWWATMPAVIGALLFTSVVLFETS